MSEPNTSEDPNKRPIETADSVSLRPDADMDWFLQNLVDLVNNTGISMGITLTVGGSLITGELVSGKKYFDDFGKTFAGDFQESSPEFIKEIQGLYAQYGEIYAPNPNGVKVPPSYIHLKDVHVYSGSSNPIPDRDGNWWRGRLSEVQGFMLGSLSASP
ncbi:MAG: hypothetical protein EOQ36_31700 [Mesorhizobium sp.]|uniref:gas vesicle accessory protein GvpU n=1 Tax=Mesorhizobium sp. TaxID=1871066 RepID=UPI000FEA109E|nr:gas vesicle accessory protein GvpU [Mesorhizobium sp.]RWF81007.1 MAG: hypothetical protein EOQ36_31700 [Mesorhizobium sp.]TJW50166.1 MAG: hypothetical protein E5X65_29880 [Mesorhizobium sp.]